ncbi:MAG TPA: MotA/TolQ/ExbB proton channel family protein, partial [Polyangiaceae bacterium]|nr:MotA/TolQ/ExbB proton channel family protein [Polyangiaceae bacterium]
MRIEERLLTIAHSGAGWVMWLLLALSVAGLAVVLERAMVLLGSHDDVARLKSDLFALLEGGEIDAAKSLLSESPSYEAKVVVAGLSSASRGAEAAEERMASEAQFARLAMEKRLGVLGTLGSNAPFVGLLGTVIGIIRAFRALESGGQMSARLMSEIGEALAATAVGLLVALPAVAFFNFFHGVIGARISRADALGRELLAHL